MKGNELVRKIRAHRGKLFVPVHSANGTMHVAVEKMDIMSQLSIYEDNETGYCMYQMDDGSWTVGPDDGSP